MNLSNNGTTLGSDTKPGVIATTQGRPNNLARKLAEVMAIVSHAPKNGYNETQRYAFTRAEDVFTLVNKELSDRGISVTPTEKLVYMNLEDADPNKKSRTIRCAVELALTFTDAETGQTFTATALGQGQDHGDKAIAKATTMAHKYAYALVFCISFGDDPEADESTDKGAETTISPRTAQKKSSKGVKNIDKVFELVRNANTAAALEATKIEILKHKGEPEYQDLVTLFKSKQQTVGVK